MKAQILKPTPENILLCAQALKRGEVVGMPTETVYGLAGNATSVDSLSKIFLTKERPTFDPLIVHVALENSTLADLMKEQLVYSHDLSNEAVKRIDLLIRSFWPGPLTLVLPKTELVPDLATSGLDFVAIRAPKHQVAQKLIRSLGLPICAPSANRFGKISPTCAKDVQEELGNKIPFILDGGDCEIGLESTILKIQNNGDMILLRPGAISREEIIVVTQSPVALISSETPGETAQASPGRLKSHYAPNKKLIMLSTPFVWPEELSLPKKVGLLVILGDPKEPAALLSQQFASQKISTEVIAESLSVKGDWKEAGANFFKTLRKLDTSEAEVLFSEPCEEKQGIGYAIADRLRRASAE